MDRGKNSLEILLILFGFLLVYPKDVHLNRGNHEDHIVNLRSVHGLPLLKLYVVARATRLLSIYVFIVHNYMLMLQMALCSMYSDYIQPPADLVVPFVFFTDTVSLKRFGENIGWVLLCILL